jgi:hypothetical protein
MSQPKAKKPKEGFFGVSLDRFQAITDELGMNECCLYLIYCCGTGKSNVTTRWSVTALEKYTSISRRRGHKAALLLSECGYVTKTKGGQHPIHEIERDKDEESIWLPKSFVMGVGDEDSPLERIRQTDDHLVLRLCVDLYWRCDIANDGGVDQNLGCVLYDKKPLTTYKQFNVIGFNAAGKQMTPCDLHSPHRDDSSGNEYQPFWDRLQTLENLGLIYECPTLFDSHGGEPICPLINPFTELPITEINDLASQVLPNWFDVHKSVHEFTPLVLKHYQGVVMRGVYILRYRQQTAKTASGYAATMERIAKYIKCTYQGEIKEVSRRDQGSIKENIKESSIIVGDVIPHDDLEPIQNVSVGAW